MPDKGCDVGATRIRMGPFVSLAFGWGTKFP